MYKKLQSNLDQKMLDINIDLHSFYSNKEDYIDEITKQNNPKYSRWRDHIKVRLR